MSASILLLRVGGLGLGSWFLLAGPAMAEVPEGFSDPSEVKFLDAFGLLVATPLALFLVISLLAYAPYLIKQQRAREVAETTGAVGATEDSPIGELTAGNNP